MDFLLKYNSENIDMASIDLVVENNDIKSDDGLVTAVLISLFTDKQCDIEEIPDGETSRRGWWGDMFPDIKDDKIGSKLWLLKREKQTDETLKRAKEYSEDSLKWMIDQKIAQSVTVETAWPSRGFLGIKVSIQQGENNLTFSFKMNWKAELSRKQY